MEILDILKELLTDAGYDWNIPKDWTGDGVARRGWHRLEAVNRNLTNRILRFTVALNNDGRLWMSKSVDGGTFNIDIHDPISLDRFKESLIQIREEHYATYSRQRQAQ